MTTYQPPLPTRRRGVYVIGDDTLCRLLRLPDGQRVMGIGTDFVRLAVLVAVEGGDLPEVPEGHDARTVNDRWPAAGPLLVAGLTPDEQHAVALAQLDAAILGPAEVLAGRRRILERHAPAYNAAEWCDYPHAGLVPWPCDDYRDAAADLVLWPDNPATAPEVHP